MSNINIEPIELLAVFNSLPGAYLLLSANFVIEAASDAYLEATLTKRKDLIGRPLFEVFPDNPQTSAVQGVKNLRASLELVVATGKPHEMACQQYDVPDPENPDQFVERHWLPINTPVLGKQGQVQHIIHNVINVTPTVQSDRLLLESQVREQTARLETERQRQQLHHAFMEAPALICLFEGPQHLFKLVNPPYQQLVGERPLVGLPIAEAMPELIGQPIIGWLDDVYRTGKSYHAYETLVQLDHRNSGDMGENYYNFIYQATRNLTGDIDGILVFAYEVTVQVQARQQVEESRSQVQNLNEELQAINEELQASNAELINTNQTLQTAQEALQEFTNKLEVLVADRTHDLQQALQKTEQQREQLKEQQTLLQQILGQVPASIATLVGPDHQYSFFNDSYQLLTGNRARLGFSVGEALPEIVSQGILSLLDQVYTTNQPLTGIDKPILLYDLYTGQPEQRYIDFIYQPLHNGQEQVQGILAFIVDVTEKVQAQQRAEDLQAEVLANTQLLVQERETFYQIFEQTPAAICIQRGPEHCYEYVNPAYQQLFPDRQLLNRPLAQALPEAVGGGFVALHDKVYQTGETYYGHESLLRLEQPGGTFLEKYFTFTYQAYREKSQIVGTTTFAFDVTNQVMTQREAKQQQFLLQKLFMDAPAPIVILDGPEFIYQLVNPAYQQIFPGRELLGKPILDALPELAGTPILATLSKVYQTGETFVAHDMTLLLARREGEPVEEMHWTFTYQARRNLRGDVDGVMVFAHEVTAQVKARRVIEESEQQAQALAAELAKANEELWVANQETQSSNEELSLANLQLKRINIDLDNFIYTASHDLKAPILNIEGLMEVLQDHLTPESLASEAVQYTMQLIMDSVQRFKDTIGHLTEITKLQKENSTEAAPVNLADLIADVQQDLAGVIRESQAKLEIDVAKCSNIQFSVKNLRSIIYNLLSNAIKYRSPNRSVVVQVRCYATAEYYVLAVVDNGLGMDLTKENQLFTMFGRLHSHVDGSGIGLYMVKKILENAGGKIEVQSKVNEGSTFQVYILRNNE